MTTLIGMIKDHKKADPVPDSKGINFSNFFTSGNYSDVQIKCEDQTFNCRLPSTQVLDTMLQNNMVMARSGLIEIRNKLHAQAHSG